MYLWASLFYLGSQVEVLESLSPAFPDLKEWFIFSITKTSKILSKHGPQPALISSALLEKLGTQDVQSLVQTPKEELKNL